MNRFGCGVVVTLLLIIVVLAIWFSLDDSTRSLITYLAAGATGMVIGGAVALAFVCILLLRQITWKVDRNPAPSPPVIVMGGQGGQPLLTAPDQQFEPPPRSGFRSQRNFRILGQDDGQDTIDGDYRQVPPGSW